MNAFGWMCQYTRNLLTDDKYLAPTLTEDERQCGEKLLLRSIQKSVFALEYKILDRGCKTKNVLINQLGLFLDNDKLIKCKGRMELSDLSYSAKFPILLPKKHEITDAIILNSHRLSLHYGLSQTVTCIRQRFWIPQIRQWVKSVLRQCRLCKKLQGKPFQTPTHLYPNSGQNYLIPLKFVV